MSRARLLKSLKWIAVSSVVGAVLFAAASFFVIDWEAADAAKYPGGAVIRDSSGNIVRITLGENDIDCRPSYEADEDDWIVKAIVAAEDGTFWTHCGVRPLSIVRALFQNIASGRRISGASTISMQTIRLVRPHRKNYRQKWIEAVKAVKMERQKDKKWIMTQYLNRIPFGSNFVGIEAAAQGWFGKSAKSLGLGEAALLAGMAQAPSRFRPDTRMDRALKRREYVLSRMLELGYITLEQKDGASGVVPELHRNPRPFAAPHFANWFVAKTKREQSAKFISGDFTTTLDAAVQAICERVVNETSEFHNYATAAVVARVSDGEVIALACSGDYSNPVNGQVNTALAYRPAGSTLKPFLVEQALILGILGTQSDVLDEPLVLQGYRPANFDGKYRGRIPLRDALILSLNLPFVRICREIGVARFCAHLSSYGFTRAAESAGLGIAVGSVEVSLMELVSAYAKFAAKKTAETYAVSEMLSGSERSAASIGHIADVELPKFAWKTGTSAVFRDAWTVAWNPEYVVGVWCGHLSGNFGDETVVGAKTAAPAAWKIIRAIYPRNDSPWFAKPDGLDAILERRLPIQEEERALAIVKPEQGSVFRLLPNRPELKIVARVIGNKSGEKLWWFLDGRPIGETNGDSPLIYDLINGDSPLKNGDSPLYFDGVVGKHSLTCTTERGVTAETEFSIER